MQDIRSPLQAQVVQWLVAAGESVAAGDVLDFIILFDATSATASSHIVICTHLEDELDVKQ